MNRQVCFILLFLYLPTGLAVSLDLAPTAGFDFWRTRLKQIDLGDDVVLVDETADRDGLRKYVYTVRSLGKEVCELAVRVDPDEGRIVSFSYHFYDKGKGGGKTSRNPEGIEMDLLGVYTLGLAAPPLDRDGGTFLWAGASGEYENAEEEAFDIRGTDGIIKVIRDRDSGICQYRVEMLKREKKVAMLEGLRKSRMVERRLEGGSGSGYEAVIGERLGPFKLGMTPAEVIDVLGEPEHQAGMDEDFKSNLLYLEKGQSFHFVGNRLTQIRLYTTRTNPWRSLFELSGKNGFEGAVRGLPGGLSLDSTLEDIVATLGQPEGGVLADVEARDSGIVKYPGIEFKTTVEGNVMYLAIKVPGEEAKEWAIQSIRSDEGMRHRSKKLETLFETDGFRPGSDYSELVAKWGDPGKEGIRVYAKDPNPFDDDDSLEVFGFSVRTQEGADAMVAHGEEFFSAFGKSMKEIANSIHDHSENLVRMYAFTDGESVGTLKITTVRKSGEETMCGGIQVLWYGDDDFLDPYPSVPSWVGP